MGKLVISLGSLPVLAVEIGEQVVRIGRSTDNDLVLPLPASVRPEAGFWQLPPPSKRRWDRPPAG